MSKRRVPKRPSAAPEEFKSELFSDLQYAAKKSCHTVAINRRINGPASTVVLPLLNRFISTVGAPAHSGERRDGVVKK